jgi:hypothetical protein
MIPFLPEMPTTSGPLATGGVLPQAPALSAVLPGPGRDFAGLLDAALPSLEGGEQAPPPALGAEAGASALAEGVVTLPAAAPPAALPIPAAVSVAVGRLPGGTILPETGAQLPPAATPLLPQTPPQAEQASPLAPQPQPEQVSLPHAAATPRLVEVAHAPLPGKIAAVPAPDASAVVPQAAPVITGRRAAPAATLPTPPELESELQGDPTALSAPTAGAVDAKVAADVGTDAGSQPAADLDPQTAPVVPTAIAALVAPTVLAPIAAAPVAAATGSTPIPPRQAARVLIDAAAPQVRAELAGLPARATLPTAPRDEAVASASAATPALLAEASAPATASAAPAPAQALAAAPAPAAAPLPTAAAAEPRALGPQQESTIAQVGDLREALRAARPELTVRHAEFGFVSLRLEQAGAEGWRAVMSSRDPGFVPAIQAALADRAVAAAAASSDSGSFQGQNGTGQNGTSDPRYGSSHSGGQGSSQPYLGQSGSRDGEAAPDQRRSSTTAVLTARAEEGEADGSPASQTRGVFA